ncbi:MAG: hypothetical protein FWE53_03720 [Firmicutes bacterium]|nr:hypothetical protein [Bacillota bacterium]
MWWKTPKYIVLMSLAAFTLLSLGLNFVWGFFSYLCVAGFAGSFGTAAVITFLGYRDFRRNVRKQRYVDAYLYAEEVGRPSAVHEFKYDRKKEYDLKLAATNKLLLFLACVFCVGACVSFFVYLITLT